MYTCLFPCFPQGKYCEKYVQLTNHCTLRIPAPLWLCDAAVPSGGGSTYIFSALLWGCVEIAWLLTDCIPSTWNVLYMKSATWKLLSTLSWYINILMIRLFFFWWFGSAWSHKSRDLALLGGRGYVLPLSGWSSPWRETETLTAEAACLCTCLSGSASVSGQCSYLFFIQDAGDCRKQLHKHF